MTTRHRTEPAPHDTSPDTAAPGRNDVAAPGPTTRQTAQALLEDAATRLERHGWLQRDIWPGALYDDAAPYREGQPCDALGALAVADGVTDAEQVLPAIATGLALSYAIDALGKHIARDDASTITDTITGWNDNPDRAAGKVIAAMRDTARALAQPAGQTPSERAGATDGGGTR